MCAPGLIEHVRSRLSRRTFFKAAGAMAATAATSSLVLDAAEARPFPRFSRVRDLTHALTPEFPTFFGVPGIGMKQLKAFKKDGFNLMEWTVLEHSGTHIDTPIHFAESGAGPDALPVDDLVVPLAVINVVAKAAANADYQLTPADIRQWERRHGRLPSGCCVAMHAGWGRHLGTAKFLGKDDGGVLHFPGFHPEAADMLLRARRVAGIAVDTLSLDHGPSKDFKTHYAWLPAGRWGLENVANLDKVPPSGATLVVGAPKIKGATGGPTRVLALV
ncbi:MAG: cyclase family protein [Hyphomonadaceae bacterium]|nr:cyclase family protein [Hyphomonadaceae bacterium]